jgi:hypothetical protein
MLLIIIYLLAQRTGFSGLAGFADLGADSFYFTKEHTNENPNAKAKSAATHGWAQLFFSYVVPYPTSKYFSIDFIGR